jgi:hypothetical protein
MKKILSLAALALGAALLTIPATSQATTLKLEGLHQGSPVHTIAMTKKKKKKMAKSKAKKKYVKKHSKKKVVSRKKKKKPAKPA